MNKTPFEIQNDIVSLIQRADHRSIGRFEIERTITPSDWRAAGFNPDDSARRRIRS
jgi:hypothetical protein